VTLLSTIANLDKTMKKPAPLRFEQLVDWTEGRLSAKEAEAITVQLETADETTRATVAWLQMFDQIAQDLRLVSLPTELRQQLADQFETHARHSHTPEILQRLVATLTFDSDAQPAVAGIRSATTSGRDDQLIYSTSIADVALNIQPGTQDKQIDLSGQVFPVDDAVDDRFVVQLLQETAEVDITITDDLGEFVFKALEPDVYDIVLSSDRIEIVIAPVDLGDQRRQT
jgi:hypothetical protein